MEYPVKISVVMPTYNTAVPVLKESVESILLQTFQDFEFIIIDDGSTNDSCTYLNSLTDSRIRLIRNPSNLGITKSLNIGFHAAKGKYIARMDSDDISFPERFEKQFTFMETHPDVIVCGARTTLIGKQKSAPKRVMEDMESYRVRMLFANPGPTHSTVLFNREKLNRFHILYDEQLTYAQDYGMWMTASQFGDVCILPEILGLYRVHPAQISQAHRQRQIECDQITQRKLLTQLLGSVTEQELDLHYHYSTGYYSEATITPQIAEWYDRLIAANAQRKIYDQKKLRKRIVQIKRILIGQTFTKEMSKREKAMLLFRYLPFFVAVQAVLEIMVLKISNIGHKKSI